MNQIGFEIHDEPLSRLVDLAAIPTAFEVLCTFEVTRDDRGQIELRERRLDCLYLKDYDAIPYNRPTDWADQFDMSNWCLVSARIAQEWVGGLLMARKTAGVEMLENRDDLAVLWDLRVNPGHRRCGIGSALFKAGTIWAMSQGCRQLKVETQNINVPACRFYARQGCELKAAWAHAYPDFPQETQLLWYRDLSSE